MSDSSLPFLLPYADVRKALRLNIKSFKKSFYVYKKVQFLGNLDNKGCKRRSI